MHCCYYVLDCNPLHFKWEGKREILSGRGGGAAMERHQWSPRLALALQSPPRPDRTVEIAAFPLKNRGNPAGCSGIRKKKEKLPNLLGIYYFLIRIGN